jgi:hypothetical protein
MEAGMHLVSMGVAWLASIGIIVVGALYLRDPRAAARSFGLPLPEAGPNIVWWLRLKGVRDVVAGLAVMAVLVWSDLRTVGIVLFVQSLIAVGDMAVILSARGSARAACGIHGLTAAVMIAAAVPLIAGAA